MTTSIDSPAPATSTSLSRRALIAGGGAALAGAALPGAASAKASTPFAAPAVIQDRITIPLFTTENDPDTMAFYENTLRQFQEEVDPNVELEITVYQDENILQYLTTAFETGTDLGIFAAPPAHVEEWAKLGYLLSLTESVQNIGEDDFLAGTRIVVDGEDYALPGQSNASALWARTDLLEAEGLNPPTTYDEFVEALEALHGKDGLVGIATGVGNVPALTLQYFSPYLFQSGWDFFDPQGNLTFDQPDVLEAVKRFAKVLEYTTPSFYNVTYPDILNLFASGRAVFGTFPGRMGVAVADNAPDIAEHVTVVPVPGGPFMTGELTFGGSQPFCVYGETAHPEETRAFLEFMLTGERLLELSMTVPGHLLPPLESVRELVPGYESEYMEKYGDWVIKLNELTPNAMSSQLSMGSVTNHQYEGKLSNVCPWGAQIWNTSPIDGHMFQQIMIEGMDPEQAWTDANDSLATVREEWLAENPDWEPSIPATPES